MTVRNAGDPSIHVGHLRTGDTESSATCASVIANELVALSKRRSRPFCIDGSPRFHLSNAGQSDDSARERKTGTAHRQINLRLISPLIRSGLVLSHDTSQALPNLTGNCDTQISLPQAVDHIVHLRLRQLGASRVDQFFDGG